MKAAHLPCLHWVCWQPTPYNDFLFRSLAADPEVDLTVHFIERKLPSHPWQSAMAQGFNSRTYQRILGLDWYLLRLAVLDRRSFFIIGGWHEPTVIALINLLIIFRRPFAIWTDTPDLYRRRNITKSLIRNMWLQRIFTHASYIMGTGKLALAALEKMSCHTTKILNFPYFIDLDTFVPISKPRKAKLDRQLIFLSSGRLVNAIKGYDIAMKALAMVKGKINNFNFLYKIAGMGPDREDLEALQKQLGVCKNVEFLGWLEPDKLPDFYRSGDIFLHPANFDPYGNSVIEAMACGIPVIGSDRTGAVIDRVEHMKNGLIHRANDADDLADKIVKMLSHIDALNEMGVLARRTVESWPISRGIETVKFVLKHY